MFRTRLRELRESLGYKSQQSFADDFGVAQSTVGGWEAGKREPNYETTIRLAKFFDVPIGYLMGEEEKDIYSERFRHNLATTLTQLQDNQVGNEPAMVDYYVLRSFTEKTHPLSLAEACQAANLIGESVSYLLQEDSNAEACSADETKKAPGMDETTPGDDLDQELMNLLGKLTVEQKYLLLALLNSTLLQNQEMLASDQKVTGDKAQ